MNDAIIGINIPTNARTFRYILSACDSSDNFGAISKLVDVVDNDAPIIIDPLLEPTTGDYLNLTIEYYDNVEVTIAKLEYGFHSDESTILDYFGNQSILVPTVATFFHYSFSIIDGNENDASISHEIPVVDNDEPIIIDNSSKTSDGYKFSVDVEDNIGIIEVKVDYWFDDVKVKFISLKLIDGIYQGTISIPKSAKNINYQISADDPSGNRGRLEKTDIILKQESDASDSAGLEIGTTEIFILLIIIIIVLVIVLFSFWRRKKRVEKVIHSESATIIKPHTRPQAIITSPQVPSAATVTIPQPRTDQQLYSQPTILKPSQLIPINVPPGPGTWPGDMAMVPAQPKNAQGPQIFTPPKPGSDEIYHEPSGGSVWEPTDDELKLEEAPDEDIATKEKIVEPQKSTDITTNSVSEERSLVKGEYEEKKNG